jgi:CheY-like chemotaxis protein
MGPSSGRFGYKEEVVAEPRKRRVLVVDDDRAIREELSAALGDDPTLEISLADDGKAALQQIATGAFWPDAILLDVMMPEVEGDEFLAALDTINKTRAIGIVVMTALPEKALPKNLRKRARSILFKPFTVARVAAALRAALED